MAPCLVEVAATAGIVEVIEIFEIVQRVLLSWSFDLRFVELTAEFFVVEEIIGIGQDDVIVGFVENFRRVKTLLAQSFKAGAGVAADEMPEFLFEFFPWCGGEATEVLVEFEKGVGLLEISKDEGRGVAAEVGGIAGAEVLE